MRVVRIVLLVAVAVGSVLVGPTTASAAGPGASIAPGSLVNGGRPCSTGTAPVLGGLAGYLQAIGRASVDTTPGLRFTFALWPVDDPSDISTLQTVRSDSGDLGSVQVPGSRFVSGTTYAWHVRVAVGSVQSAWSPTCSFVVDTTAPPAPTVTSNYPPAEEGFGPVGERAHFVFRARGNPDVAGYMFLWGDVLPVLGCSQSGRQGQLVCPDFLSGRYVIRAPSPGAAVRVDLDPPSFGSNRLSVASVDIAGNVSNRVQYELEAPFTSPVVSVVGQQAICGRTATLAFSPADGLTNVASYSVTLGGRPATSVPAGADGTATAAIVVQPTDGVAEVVSIGRNGFRSTERLLRLSVGPKPDVDSDVYRNSGQPVGGVGVAGTFTFDGPFYAGFPERYVYSVDGGPTQQVPFDEDTLQTHVTWSPTHAGPTTLMVRSVTTDAGASCWSTYSFDVAN